MSPGSVPHEESAAPTPAAADSFREIRVGVGVILRKEGRVLLGLRISAHGQGTWSFPGGHQEKGETAPEAAARELEEETGIRLSPSAFRILTSTDDLFAESGRQYTTVFVVGDCPGDQDARNDPPREPLKSSGWRWFSWQRLPEPRFAGIGDLLSRGVDPFDLPAWAEPPRGRSA